MWCKKSAVRSLETLPDKLRVQSSVLGEADISRLFTYTEGGLLPRDLELLGVVVGAGGDPFPLLGEELAIDLWNGVLRSLGIVRLEYHVLRHVVARSNSATKVEVLFHAFVADFFPLIMLIKE